MTIIEAIHLGLRRGYYQYKQLDDSPLGFEGKMTEYLLTVFVGIELNDAETTVNHKKIRLEYPLWQFYNNAFPKIRQLNKDDLFNQSDFIKSEYKKKNTKQRIDIAIIGKDVDDNERSYHGIELKAINTNYNGTLNDLQRLSNAMITNDVSDTNSITSCFFGCIKSYQNIGKPMSKNEIETSRKDVIKNIEDLLDTNFRSNTIYTRLDYKIYFEEINSQSSEEYLNSYSGKIDKPAYDEAANNTGEAISIIIEIKRK